MINFSNIVTRAFVGFAGVSVGALLCFGASATPAQARGNDQLPTVSVSYADLDVTSPAGRAQLDRRIDHAAYLVCHSDSATVSIDTMPTRRECMRLAIANATPVRH